MQLEAFSQLRDEGFTLKEARTRAKTLATQLMIDVKTKIESQLGMYKYPPKDYVSLAGMNKHNADCDSLLRCTANALDEIGLQKLVVSTQHANVEHKIEFTVKFMIKAVHNVSYNKKYLELGIVGWMPYTKLVSNVIPLTFC
ncbi:hypothetical protein J3A83DRAFT_1997938 [Scleroderma citrinum]